MLIFLNFTHQFNLGEFRNGDSHANFNGLNQIDLCQLNDCHVYGKRIDSHKPMDSGCKSSISKRHIKKN